MTGLSTLANGASATSNTIDLTTDEPLDVLIEGVFTTNSSAVADGLVRLFLKPSINTSSTDFSTDVNDIPLIVCKLSGAGVGTHKIVVSLATALNGTLPPFVQIRVLNNTTGAFTAGTLAYRIVTGQSV